MTDVDFEGKLCQETFAFVDNKYLQCEQPAVMLVKHRGRAEGPYFMCLEHGTHNADNRNAEVLAKKPELSAPERLAELLTTKITAARQQQAPAPDSVRIARGKYKGLTLPRLVEDEKPDYQAKIDAFKTKLQANENFKPQASWLAREYMALRSAKDILDDEMHALNIRLTAVTQMMAAQFEGEGIDNIKVDGRLVSVYLEPFSTVKDREAFRDWCLENPDLSRKLALPWQTTNDLAKKMLQNGEELPPGVEVYAATKIRLGGQ